jgi:LuxR family transcriptional regulator, maltose regulon positive regulatory protein
LCDDVLETEGSAELLGALERSNLFLLALDDRRHWYRYHQLFAELLRLELGNREPALVPALHRRAAAWHRRHGDVEDTIHHLTAAGEFAEAGRLIARHWLGHWRRGRGATVSRWLQELPDQAIAADPPVAFVAAWIGGSSGASKQETERWLAAAEDNRWEGPLPEGISSLAFGAALARAAVLFDDVGRARQAAHHALELAGPEPSPFHWMAQAALGQALYLSGQPAGARPPLEVLVRRVSAAEQPYAVVAALALLSLMAGDEDNHAEAEALARRAAEAAEAQGITAVPLSAIAHVALGRTRLRAGRLAEAQERLEWALELYQIEGMAVHRAHTLVLLAAARQGQDDLAGAGTLRQRACELIGELADPGMLPALLQRTSRTPGPAPLRQAKVSGSLTERELAVLRLLPTRLSTPEIGRELHVSVNTVRSQVRSVYRKLGATSRAEAVTLAQELGLLSRR